ncbi:PhzF family phenazine biosynthesis protein [Aspergillus homomorphus CBS 101889]|uniref:Diaminopimelate epimerase-like protein n=1 Tax=Aspergillus homomorphus (strain CBS 101889) TaxID=1450537 RepID=A0A395I0D3_ASPHC|nr:Diaminopimelate epimerase-like protein [Aspergillus homomorphus CBS 101889]RAL13652.1 Diaminopimelate epimerase-like protein [Aspergillus homomorphus CBS 101889]
MPATHLKYMTLDVFTSTVYAGNPLAVVFLPNDHTTNPITQRQKQTLAREFNFSETIFVHPPGANATSAKQRTIDIFTTTSELPFAGHPTIGAASWFLHHGPQAASSSFSTPNKEEEQVTHLVTKSGAIPISLAHQPSSSGPNNGGEGVVVARIAHNVHLHSKRFPLAELLRLHGSLAPFYTCASTSTEKEISFPIFSIVKGMTQVHVELPSLAALAAVTTAAGGELIGADSGYLDEGWDEGHCVVYFSVREVEDNEDNDDDDDQSGIRRPEVIRTRAVVGNLEDPATGSAASGLAAYLALSTPHTEKNIKKLMEFEVVQGVEMGRRSKIGVEVEMRDAETIAHVDLKGAAVKVSEGSIVVPP